MPNNPPQLKTGTHIYPQDTNSRVCIAYTSLRHTCYLKYLAIVKRYFYGPIILNSVRRLMHKLNSSIRKLQQIQHIGKWAICNLDKTT